MKPVIWILIANSSQAKIYKADDKKTLTPIQKFEHPESHWRNDELSETKSGKNTARFRQGPHVYSSHVSPKVREFQNFAEELSHFLEEAVIHGKYQKLYLVANPSFLGELRQFMKPHSLEKVVQQIDKDLTHLPIQEVRGHLPYLL